MVTDPVIEAHRRLAGRMLALVGVLAVVLAAIAGAVAGRAGAVSAFIGVGFVLLLFGASAAGLAWTVERRPGAALGVLVGGAVARVLIYAASLNVLATVAWIDRLTLAVATGTAVVITLVAELRWVSQMPQLFWVDAGAGQATAVSHATRSSSL